MPPPAERPAAGEPPVRPQPAAGLVLLRGRGRRCEVLLGRRHGAASFMPGVYVFPGGRLEAADHAPSGLPETPPAARGNIDGESRRRLMAFGRAALRETREETGLLIGEPLAGVPSDRLQPAWRCFAEARLAPALGALVLLARAITPRGSRQRFHTRFFLGRCETLQVAGRLGGDGELEDVGWKPLAGIDALPMPGVTRRVLARAVAVRAGRAPAQTVLLAWRRRPPLRGAA